MTNQQPEALRLARENEADAYGYPAGTVGYQLHMDTAAELRRLHAENQILLDLCNRSLRALSEDDFPILREELRHFTQEKGQDD